MTIRNISEAKAELSALTQEAPQGHDVAITDAGSRVPGALAGRIRIAPDFDALPADMEQAFGMKDGQPA